MGSKQAGTWRVALVLVAVGAVVAAACTVGSTAERRAPADADATIERVVDGDTVVLAGGTRVRLIGIDTPETVDPRRPVECFGHEASARLRELLPAGTPVRLEYDVERTDRYGRTLAYLYRADDGLFVNETMAREGFAEQLTIPPNVAHVDDLAAAVADARQAQRGLWRPDACVGT